MQMVKKGIIIFIVVWMAIIILMPKHELYYKLEEELSKQEVMLNEEQIDEGLFSLKLKGVSVYVKGINVATIKEVTMGTLLFYNCLKLEDIEVDDSLKMVPTKTKVVTAKHSILSPMVLSVGAEGSFGVMEGSVDLSERHVRLDFNESKGLEMLKPGLRKEEKGWVYETSF